MLHKMSLILCGLLLMCFSTANSVYAADIFIDGPVVLKWVPPTTKIDGSALDNLAGYKIYYSTVSGDYSASTPIDLTDAGATEWSFTVPVTGDVQLYFSMSAYNTLGAEGPLSNEVVKQIKVNIEDSTPPSPPVLSDVQLNFTCVTNSQYVTCTITVQ